MPIKILMPALSPTMTSGNLTKWLKKEGDKVSPGEVIAEIETDKATMEVESVDEGIMGKIIVKEGSENIAVNSLIAIILEENETIEDLLGFEDKNEQKTTNQQIEKPESKVNLEPVIKISDNKNDRVFISPLAKRLAESANIDLVNIKGSGPHGRIVKADILIAQNQQNVKGLCHSLNEHRIVANTNIRKIIAKRLVESKQMIPHFYLSIECNIDKLLMLRQELNSSFSDDNHKISVNDIIIAATAKALREVWEVNASWGDESICYYNNIDISVAVAIDGGLITPVVRFADKKDIVSLSKEVKSLVLRAKQNKLTPEEFQGGGFTISNLGMYGIKSFNAIINPPQSCILAVGNGEKRPVVIDDKIVIANMINLTMSCDHRVVDGVVGAKFLSVFKKLIEKPLLILV